MDNSAVLNYIRTTMWLRVRRDLLEMSELYCSTSFMGDDMVKRIAKFVEEINKDVLGMQMDLEIEFNIVRPISYKPTSIRK